VVVETIVVVSGKTASGIEIVGNVVVSTFSELAVRLLSLLKNVLIIKKAFNTKTIDINPIFMYFF